MEAFKEFPWEEAQAPTEAPDATAEPSATNNPTETASMQSTQGTSVGESATSVRSSMQISSTTQGPSYSITSSETTPSSSGTSTPTAEPKQEYAVHSKSGTSNETFVAFINELDEGKGSLYTWDALGGHLHLAKINATQAGELAKNHDFISYVFGNALDESELESHDEFRVIDLEQLTDPGREYDQETTRSTKLTNTPLVHVNLVTRMMLPEDSNAPYWKNMIGAPPCDITGPNSGPPSDPSYLADDTGGRGTTIYVLDNGFDITNPVSVLCFHIVSLLIRTGSPG
jgi:hypothetical protein